MDHFYQKIEGWFDYADLYQKVVTDAKHGNHFVEIGAWFGCSTAHMAVEIINSGKQIQFDVVDTWKGSPNEEIHLEKVRSCGGSILPQFLHHMTEGKVIDYIRPLEMLSEEASKLYADHSLDFVYIDACHLYESIYNDIKCWKDKIKPGGILAGHDYDFDSVQNAVHDLLGPTTPSFQRSWIYVVPFIA